MALPEISLDPRNESELLEQAAQYAIDKSGGQLGNLSPANPLLFLLEAQVFAGAELLWYLNQLPSKLLIQFLNYWGVTTTEGTRATTNLTVTLTGPLSTAITLPTGLLFSDGVNLYESISPVVVASGATSATVPVQCTVPGLIGNVPAFSVNQIVTPVAYLKTCTNPNIINTGVDPIGTDQAIESFVGSLRSEQCISEVDYLRVSQGFLGGGWDVRVLPNTDPNTNQEDIGSVAVLIGNPKSITPPTATAIALQTHLTQKAPIISRVWVSTLDYQPVVIKVYATTQIGVKSQDVADLMFELIQEHLTTNPRKISDRDLTIIGDRSGCNVTASTVNSLNSYSVSSVRESLYLKYLEVQITPDNRDMIKGDDTRLLWGSESGELFIYGDGDEN